MSAHLPERAQRAERAQRRGRTLLPERAERRGSTLLPERAQRVEGRPDESDAEPAPWRRLNPRMLLVHPVRELIKYLPVLLVAVVAGSVGGEPWWTYALSGLGVVVGILRWITTSYRITATHVQVRRGLLNRRMLSVPRERIRSVDVDATLLHRLVGLAVVKVGTSASHGHDGLDFDGIAAADVPPLRAELLRGVSGVAEPAEKAPAVRMAAAEAEGRDFSGWRWTWARFAPFTLTGVAALVAAAFFALQLQFFDGGLLVRLPIVRAGIAAAARVPVPELVVGAVLALVVAASVIALVRYVLAYSGFALWRSDATSLHVRHGLLRTRQVTLDERRLRGVSLNEPLSLRVAGAVLGDADSLVCELDGHGPRAHRRRYTRAATGVLVLALVALTAQLLGYVGGWIWGAFVIIVPLAPLLAADRWRSLGHTLLPGLLITRHGSLARKRVALQTAGIIGFTVRRSLFQRRAGLATLIATTAAGRHRYSIPDVPVEEAWRIAEEVLVREPYAPGTPARAVAPRTASTGTTAAASASPREGVPRARAA